MMHCIENITESKSRFHLSSYALTKSWYPSKIILSWNKTTNNEALLSRDTKKLKYFEQHRVFEFPKRCKIS